MSSPSNRDHSFPATSIGRTQSLRVQRNQSHDSISSTSHPLLSPQAANSALNQLGSGSVGTGNFGDNPSVYPPHPPHRAATPTPQSQTHTPTGSTLNAPRYVPYTPRHRVGTSGTSSSSVNTTTTTTTIYPQTVNSSPGSQTPTSQYQSHPYSIQHIQHSGDTTTRLQMMNLQAAAQDVGVKPGSVGWAILEKLIGVHVAADGWYGEGSEWEEIWRMFTMGKATLLLPVEPLHVADKITPDFIKDHVVLCENPSRESSSIVTLSGLRGVLHGDKLVLRSSLSPASKLFQSLLVPSTRSNAISKLPPLSRFMVLSPTPPKDTEGADPSNNDSGTRTGPPPLPARPVSHYPTFTVSSHTILPVPPRLIPISASVHQKSASTSSFLSPRRSTTPTPQSISPLHVGGPLAQSAASTSPAVATSSPATTSPTVSSAGSSRIPSAFLTLFGGRGYNPRDAQNNSNVASSGNAPKTTPLVTLDGVPPANPSPMVPTFPPSVPVTSPQPIVPASSPASITSFPSMPWSSLTSSSASTTTHTNSSSSSLVSTSTAATLVSTTGAPPPPPSTSTGNPALLVQRPAPTLIDITVFTIDRKIVRRDVGRAMAKVLRAEVKAGLGGSARAAKAAARTEGQIQVPGWVIERVHEFTSDWYPVVKGFIPIGIWNPSTPPVSPTTNTITITETGQISQPQGTGGIMTASTEKGYIANMIEETPEELVERVQDFYQWLEEDLERIEGEGGFKKKWNASSSALSVGGGGKTPDKDKVRDGDGEDDKAAKLELLNDELPAGAENRFKDIVELVEKTITELFYDRLFMQPTSDDGAHDEALESRVAALNMLDLGLEHLDVVVGDKIKGRNEEETRKLRRKEIEKVGEVVKACGELLGKMEDVYAPVDKTAILVAAHKVVVDGLSKLPPVRLKTDEEKEAEREKKKREQEAGTTGKIKGPGQAVYKKSNLGTEAGSAAEGKKGSTSESTAQSSASTAAPAIAADNNTSQPPSSPPSTSKPHKATPVSGDVLLPMIIYSVVKSNPPRLFSNLLYTQRFRNQAVVGNGEEGYCLINLMAVAEFLEYVDLEGLGLEGKEGAVSLADLKPIPINRPTHGASPRASPRILTPIIPSQASTNFLLSAGGAFRGKVEQQVDAIAGSANKVLTGVVDSSFGMFRSLLPGSGPGAGGGGKEAADGRTILPRMDSTQVSAPWNFPSATLGDITTSATTGGFGILRRGDSGFSVSSFLPGGASRGQEQSKGEESGQQLMPVSRPGSLRRRRPEMSRYGRSSHGRVESTDVALGGTRLAEGLAEGEGEGGGSDASVSDEEVEGGDIYGEDGYFDTHEDGADGIATSGGAGGTDGKGIKSFENMLSAAKSTQGAKKSSGSNTGQGTNSAPHGAGSYSSLPRKSLTDRLASVSAMKNSPPTSRAGSISLQAAFSDTPTSSRPASPAPPSLRAPSPLLGGQQSLPGPVPSITSTPASAPTLVVASTATATTPTASTYAQQPLLPRLHIAAPIQKFLECAPDDLKISEVRELLQEYRRIVEDVRSIGAFGDGED